MLDLSCYALQASPHTRGWTRLHPGRSGGGRGFPAHAGMDPWTVRDDNCAARLPRTRGDGPRCAPSGARDRKASPHTRGWTPLGVGRLVERVGFPAHAGMDPRMCGPRGARARLPRTRGDGPWPDGPTACCASASPHTRGWTGRLCGNCIIAAASPHTRGWTRYHCAQTLCGAGFPAHAGMDPAARSPLRSARRLPRTRGDGPESPTATDLSYQASPHTRGWTPCRREPPQRLDGFPAHAGMDPPYCRAPRIASGLPRTRGDGPWWPSSLQSITTASPHTRGWTRVLADDGEDGDGFPAHAGMDLDLIGLSRPHQGFPAHAGMDPRRHTRQRSS